jgi:hypothetical protein
MNQVALYRSVEKASRESLTACFPTSRFLSMSTAKRFIVSLTVAVGWTLSCARPVFA